ncbi:response regulator [Glaciihabitans sp. INWT7]|uniref:response regulator n=1 Tax=Glaciihabitans sp. INWT7 TaxID=2596912 RepID=UPI00162618BB|nr:response regulator [Glaciihabitans sp. INWT7]QNE46526.1 response regulator [Glaciihabitans sp. INWT7]
MIRTLVVEDDPLTAEAHAEYLGRLEGFELAGIARTAAAAQAAIRTPEDHGGIDLVLLDMNLPDGHGLELARRIRSSGIAVDIIAITAVRETDVVRTAINVGIVQYLIKPFSFAVFRDRLESYLDFRRQLEFSGSSTTQSDIDGMLASLRPSAPAALPKGLAASTLAVVIRYLKQAPGPVSAVQAAAALDLSRVTARRYLEHLSDDQRAIRTSRYGAPGRPEFEYRWMS